MILRMSPRNNRFEDTQNYHRKKRYDQRYTEIPPQYAPQRKFNIISGPTNPNSLRGNNQRGGNRPNYTNSSNPNLDNK